MTDNLNKKRKKNKKIFNLTTLGVFIFFIPLIYLAFSKKRKSLAVKVPVIFFHHTFIRSSEFHGLNYWNI